MKPGLAADGFVQLQEGVAEGDVVVAKAGSFLRDGDVVRPVPARQDRGGRRGSVMRLNVSAWSIRKPIPSIVLFIVLIVLGVFSFRQLPITRFPNIDIPIVTVTVTQSGAAPSELQNQVTKRVEDAVAGVNGVKHIISTISEGLSTTTIEFRLEINTRPRRQRRQGRDRQDPRRPAAHHRRADRAAGRRSPACRSSPTPPPTRR